MSGIDQILAGYAGLRDAQEEFYKDLHQHPELSHQEQRTARRAAEWLQRCGYEVRAGIGGTGVVGVLANGSGPAVLLRADMDALPVREDTRADYASTATGHDADGSQVPVAHACGHDLHVSCLVGMAKLMADQPGLWNGTLIALFQPAEETGDGAQGMVDDGLLDGIPAPKVALAQHVLPGIAGTVGTRSGPALSAADSIKLTVYGRGGHGSMPQNTIDPVVLAAIIIVRLQTVVSRMVDPSQTAVLTVGSCQAGTKSNVIPDRAILQLNMRTYSQQTRERMLAAVQRIVTAECQASGSPRIPTSRSSIASRSPTTTTPPQSGWPPLSASISATAPPNSPADRQRGLQRYPPGRGHSLHLLGHRRHRPAGLRRRREGRARPGRHSRQPFPQVPARAAAHPAHRYRDPDRRRDGLAGGQAGNMSRRTP